MTTPNRPPGRYDEPRTLPRPVLIAVGAVLLTLLTAGVYGVYRHANHGRVDFATVGYRVVNDRSMTVTFDVRKPLSQVVVCQVEALDKDRAVVGTAEVRVGPSRSESVRTNQTLVTTGRAAAGDVTGCQATAP